MSEEEKKDEEEETEEGAESGAPNLVGDAKNVVEALKRENDRKEELQKKEELLLAKKEDIEAKARLAGRAEAGAQPTKKEETDKEYHQRIKKELAEGKHNDKG